MAGAPLEMCRCRYRSLGGQFKFSGLAMLCNILLLSLATGTTAIETGTGPFQQCLQQRQLSSIGTCLGQQTLTYLQKLEDSQNVTLFDDLHIERADKNLPLGTQSRSIVNFLDYDPTDFK